MTKVLFFCQDAFSSVGGLQQFNMRFIRALNSNRGFLNIVPDVFVLNDRKSDHPRDFSESLHTAKSGLFSFLIKLFFAGVGSNIVVLGHVNLLPAAVVFKLFNPKLRIILIGHGIEVWPDSGYRKKKLFDVAILKTCVSEFWGVSQYTVDVFSRSFYFSRTRCRIFPNAVDVDSASLMPARVRGDRVVTVSRLGLSERGKNVDKLILAMDILKEQGRNILLDIVGSGQLVDEYRDMVQNLALQDIVTLHGRVSDELLRNIYSNASIFALPSVKEGFGIVFLEAWLAGLAVIGVDAGGVPDVISDSEDGLLLNSPDPKLIAEAIIFLCDNPDLRSIYCINGLKKVNEFYSNTAFVQRLGSYLTSGRLS